MNQIQVTRGAVTPRPTREIERRRGGNAIAVIVCISVVVLFTAVLAYREHHHKTRLRDAVATLRAELDIAYDVQKGMSNTANNLLDMVGRQTADVNRGSLVVNTLNKVLESVPVIMPDAVAPELRLNPALQQYWAELIAWKDVLNAASELTSIAAQ